MFKTMVIHINIRLHSKINIKENPHLTVYSFPSIECELCKSLIPGNLLSEYRAD